MALIPGIQISSTFARNSAGPVDGKMRLSTTNRLNLSFVQRWLGMLVYDSDLNVWKKLINNPAGDTTIEDDWVDFTSSSESGGATGPPRLKNVVYVIDGEDEIEGIRYDSIANALSYITTQIPSIDNKWIIQVSTGTYTENVTIPDWVAIKGSGMESTILNGIIKSAGTPSTNYTKNLIEDCTINTLRFDGNQSILVSNCIIQDGVDFEDASSGVLKAKNSIFLDGSWIHLDQIQLDNCIVNGGAYAANNLNIVESIVAPTQTNISLGKTVNIIDSRISYDYNSTNFTTFTNETAVTTLYNTIYPTMNGFGSLSPTFNTPNRTYNFYNSCLGNAIFTAGTFNHFNTAHNSLIETKNIYLDEGTIQHLPFNAKDLVNKEYVDAIAGGIPYTALLKNVVNVNSTITEVAGVTYQSINEALFFINTQTPSINNKWIIQLGSEEYTENVTIPEYVIIRGKDKQNSILSGEIRTSGPFPTEPNDGAFISDVTIKNLIFDSDNFLILKSCRITGGSDTAGGSNASCLMYDCDIINGTWTNILIWVMHNSQIFGGTITASDLHFYRECYFVPYNDIILGGDVKITNSTIYYSSIGTVTFTNTSNLTEMENVSYVVKESHGTYAPTFDTVNRTYNFYNTYLANATFTAGTFNHYGTVENSKNTFSQIESQGKSAYKAVTDMGTDDEDFAHKKYVDDNVGNSDQESAYIRDFIGKDLAGEETPNYSSHAIVDSTADLETAISQLDLALSNFESFDMPKNSVLVDPSVDEVVGERYQTINNALIYIATQTPTYDNRWAVEICIGTFTEDITIPDWVLLKGSGLESTILDGELTINYNDSTNDDYWFRNSIEGCRITNLYFDREATLNLSKCYITGGSQTIDAVGSKLNAFNCVFTGGTWDDLAHIQIIESTILGGTFAANELTYFQECIILPKQDNISFGKNVSLVDCRLSYDYGETGNYVTFTDESTAFLFNVIYPLYGYSFNKPVFNTPNRKYKFYNCYLGNATFTAGTFEFYNTSDSVQSLFKQIEIYGTARYNNITDMGSTDVDLTHKKYVDDEISTAVGAIPEQVQSDWLVTNALSKAFIKNKPTELFTNLQNIITVDPIKDVIGGMRYQTVADAVDYITNFGSPAADNQWLIQLGAGEYVEDINLDNYINLRGMGKETYINGEMTCGNNEILSDFRISNFHCTQAKAVNLYIDLITISNNVYVKFFNCEIENAIRTDYGLYDDCLFYNCIFHGGNLNKYGSVHSKIEYHYCTFEPNNTDIDLTGAGPAIFYFCVFKPGDYDINYNYGSHTLYTCYFRYNIDFNFGGTFTFYNCFMGNPTYTSGTFNFVNTIDSTLLSRFKDVYLDSGTIQATPTADKDIVNLEYLPVFEALPTIYNLPSDLTYIGKPLSDTVGESVVFGDFLYKKISDGKWYKCRSISIGYLPCAAMALESKVNGETCLLLQPGGYARNDSWSWTDTGSVRILYAGHTPGVLSEEEPTLSGYIRQAVAVILASNIIYFYPSIDLEEVL